jgi:hypothetical protein
MLFHTFDSTISIGMGNMFQLSLISDLLSLQNSSLKHKTFMPLMTLLGMSEGNCLCSK